MEYVKISSIKLNPANPRIIRDENYRKLVQSVAQFPAMLDVRGVVVDGQKMILGGNQRWRAILDILKMPESDLKQACGENETAYALWEVLHEKKAVPAKWILDGSAMTDDEIRRFIIADNVEFGEHDWDALANEWDVEELADWGVEVPDYKFTPSDDELTGELKNKDAVIKITFQSHEDLVDCEPKLKDFLLSVSPNSFYSVSAGEI